MPGKPKLVPDLIRDEADIAEANQDHVAAHELRRIADEMDNDKNGSLHGPSNPHPR
jgi:hypothetical protein